VVDEIDTRPRPPLVPIAALGLLTIVTYGACYYAYGVLIAPISSDSHWPQAALGIIFSAVLLITGVGGALAGGCSTVWVSSRSFFLRRRWVPALWSRHPFRRPCPRLPSNKYAGGCGTVGAIGFCHITQSVAAGAAPGVAPRAIIWVTLIGALAGPIYMPVTGQLAVSLGWRATIRIDAATVTGAFLLAAVLVKGRGRTVSSPRPVSW
jgi:hypothetical protein